MRISPIIRLKNNLLIDIDYIKYEEIYSKESVIDKNLLVQLLNKHHDLYYVFLKMNIFLYRFDTKGLNDELKDFSHYKKTVLRIDDLSHILGLYYRHYSMFIETIKVMISDNLVPKNEVKILKMIINNPKEEQIRPTFDYEDMKDE